MPYVQPNPESQPSPPRLLALARTLVGCMVFPLPIGQEATSIRAGGWPVLSNTPASKLPIFTSLSLFNRRSSRSIACEGSLRRHAPDAACVSVQAAPDTQHRATLPQTNTGQLHFDPLCNQATLRHHAVCQRYFGPSNDLALQPCLSTGCSAPGCFLSARGYICARELVLPFTFTHVVAP